MRLSAAVATALVATALLAGSASGARTVKPRVTLFGDSVAAALNYEAKARRLLGKGIDLQIDARVCRRLAATGCPYEGVRPDSVLTLVDRPREPLGDLVVIDVGYNDPPDGYGDDVDRVMRLLTRDGVSIVVWVTLQESRAMYRNTNAAIRTAAKRWPQIRVADWDDASRARDAWFVGDGLHLTSAGALGLARFLRPFVASQACKRSCRRLQHV